MFKNRKEAGLKLAEALKPFEKKRPLVLAIPRGGVEIGYHIQNELSCDLSVVVARKLGHPEQPEAAFGAMAEDKSLYLNPITHEILTKEMIERVMKKEEKEIRRRIQRYRGDKPLPEMKGRTVIIVDDGIATGATLFATIELCKKREPRRIIVAAPVSGLSIVEKLQYRVDEVVILETPANYYAVSQAYEEFRNLSDEDVLRFLKKATRKSERGKSNFINA